jgi:cyanate permease
MLHPQVLLLSLVYAGSSAASNGLSLWQPQIIKSYGLTNMQAGLLNSIPFALASVAMIFWARRSDRHDERVWSSVLPLALSALALCGCLLTSTLLPIVIFLSFALIGTYSFKGPFWALSTETLGAGAAAAGLAQINAIGNLAGFGGTYLIGVIHEATGSYPLALLPLLLLEAIGCVTVLILGWHRKRATPAAEAL